MVRCSRLSVDKQDRVEVWKLEEKQTDVNIALHLYRDAMIKSCEQSVLVSSDSDLETSLKFPQGQKSRPANASLSNLADWTRQYILDDELAKFQMPERVPTKKKPAIKPDYW